MLYFSILADQNKSYSSLNLPLIGQAVLEMVESGEPKAEDIYSKSLPNFVLLLTHYDNTQYTRFFTAVEMVIFRRKIVISFSIFLKT